MLSNVFSTSRVFSLHNTKQVILRSLSDAKNAFGAFYLSTSFFDQFEIGASPTESVMCKFPVRSILTVLRSLRTVERARMSFEKQRATHYIVVQMECKHGVVRTHQFSYEPCGIQHASFDRTRAPHCIVGAPVSFGQYAETIKSRQEITLEAGPRFVELRTYAAGATFDKPQSVDALRSPDLMQSSIRVDVAELQDVIVNKAHAVEHVPTEEEVRRGRTPPQPYSVEITFSLKEYRAMLSLCEQANPDDPQVALFFEQPGYPVLVSTSTLAGGAASHASFYADLVLVTMEDEEDGSTTTGTGTNTTGTGSARGGGGTPRAHMGQAATPSSGGSQRGPVSAPPSTAAEGASAAKESGSRSGRGGHTKEQSAAAGEHSLSMSAGGTHPGAGRHAQAHSVRAGEVSGIGSIPMASGEGAQPESFMRTSQSRGMGAAPGMGGATQGDGDGDKTAATIRLGADGRSSVGAGAAAGVRGASHRDGEDEGEDEDEDADEDEDEDDMLGGTAATMPSATAGAGSGGTLADADGNEAAARALGTGGETGSKGGKGSAVDEGGAEQDDAGHGSADDEPPPQKKRRSSRRTSARRKKD